MKYSGESLQFMILLNWCKPLCTGRNPGFLFVEGFNDLKDGFEKHEQKFE